MIENFSFFRKITKATKTKEGSRNENEKSLLAGYPSTSLLTLNAP